MANGLEHAFFYASQDHDRVYSASSFEYWLKKFFTTGVFEGEMLVTANDNMTVTLGSGYANVDGKVKFFEESQTFTLDTADATYDRIDSVVIERNDTDRDITAKVEKGGTSSNPYALTPVRQNGIYQLVVAQIRVNHGAVSITQADITDTRTNTDLCGIVAGTVKEMDFSQFQLQFESYFAAYKKEIFNEFEKYQKEIQQLEEEYQADVERLKKEGQASYDNMAETLKDENAQFTELFQTWFDSMKDQLSTDAAGNLQLEIDELKKAVVECEEVTRVAAEDGSFLETEDGYLMAVG